MKKVIISSCRQTREHKANPYQNIDLNERMIKSKCVNYKDNSEIVDLGNGYSRIVPKDSSKKVK